MKKLLLGTVIVTGLYASTMSKVSADVVDFDIVTIQPKDAVTLTKMLPLQASNDVYLVVDRSEYQSLSQHKQISDLVKKLIETTGENDRIALAFSDGHSSSIELTHELTKDKSKILSQLEKDETIVNANVAKFPKYGDKKNIFSYIENLTNRAQNSHFVYISDGDSGKSKFALEKYQLGVRSKETVFDFLNRMNVSLDPIILSNEDSVFATQFSQKSIKPVALPEFFKNSDDSQKAVDSLKEDLQSREIELETSNKQVTLKQASIVDAKGNEQSLTIENNKVLSKVTLDKPGDYLLKYQFSGLESDESASMNVKVKSNKKDLLRQSTQLFEKLKKVIDL